jgi:heme-degrading monooxygenase HmoA
MRSTSADAVLAVGIATPEEPMTIPFAKTPPPPYTAVIFTSLRRDADHAEYAMAAERMAELVLQQPGYLGMESVRDATGLGITVSYWTSPGAAAAWKAQAEHRLTQDRGRKAFYESYALRICEVTREATFDGSSRAERVS